MPKSDGHHTWTEAQLAAYEARWLLGTRERLAYDVLLYSAQRVGDVVGLAEPERQPNHEVGPDVADDILRDRFGVGKQLRHRVRTRA